MPHSSTPPQGDCCKCPFPKNYPRLGCPPHHFSTPLTPQFTHQTLLNACSMFHHACTTSSLKQELSRVQPDMP